MARFTNKIALVTGGSSGIGLATAKRLVQEEAYVFITARRQAELDKAVEEIGRNVTAVEGDVANLEDLDRLYETIGRKKGALDFVVANAAFVEMATLAEATPEHFDRTFQVNARGTFFTVQKALPLLRNGGAIVLVASAAHLVGVPVYTTYSATKAAVRSFARTWAAELKDRGIRVNSVSPGLTDTPLIAEQVQTTAQAEAMKAQFAKQSPLGRFAQPDEIASAILFLASQDSSFCTGIDLVADGGITEV